MNSKQLWGSILQQAISGKLVEQLDSEPAVEQIGPAPAPEEVTFEIPEKWKWVQAKYLGDWKSGQTPSRTTTAFWTKGTVRWLKSGEITDGLIANIEERVTEQAVADLRLRVNPQGSVVIALYGATAGKVGILKDSCVTNQACCACIVNQQLISNWYLFYALRAVRATLLLKSSGSAQSNLSKEKVVSTWIPVPPLAEQHRIVAKLEELKPLVENFGKAQEQLVKLEEEFPRKLKASVLQYALSGQLVEQLDSEPAVEQIGTAPAPEEVPFEIPEKWKWVNLSHLVNIINGDRGSNYPSKSKLTNVDTGYPFVSACDLENHEISSQSLLFMNEQQNQSLRCGHIQSGDFLLCIRGSLGKFAIAKASGGAIASSLVILRIKSPQVLEANFLSSFLSSSWFKSQIEQARNGTCQPNLGAKVLAGFLVPLPPIAEQHRIVAKLDEVLAEVGKVEQSMSTLRK